MGPCAVGTRLRREGIVRKREHLSRKELGEARLDAAWEARHEISRQIVCRECGQYMAEINATGDHSHLRTHCMTRDEYFKKYPGARFVSFARSASQAARQDRHTSTQTLMVDFAARYLTSKELIECRKDYDWEKRCGFDFVACRKCGIKIRTELHAHLKRHGYKGAGEYRIEYPRVPLVAEHHKASFRRPYAKTSYAARKVRLAELASGGAAGKRIEELHASQLRAAELRKQLDKAEEQVRQLQLTVEGQPAVIRDKVFRHVPSFENLFALPDIKRNRRVLLDTWKHPDFSPEQINAARKAVLARATSAKLALTAARHFVSDDTRYSFDTVRRYSS